jgi:hypothetical protein
MNYTIHPTLGSIRQEDHRDSKSEYEEDNSAVKSEEYAEEDLESSSGHRVLA